MILLDGGFVSVVFLKGTVVHIALLNLCILQNSRCVCVSLFVVDACDT